MTGAGVMDLPDFGCDPRFSHDVIIIIVISTR